MKSLIKRGWVKYDCMIVNEVDTCSFSAASYSAPSSDSHTCGLSFEQAFEKRENRHGNLPRSFLLANDCFDLRGSRRDALFDPTARGSRIFREEYAC